MSHQRAPQVAAPKASGEATDALGIAALADRSQVPGVARDVLRYPSGFLPSSFSYHLGRSGEESATDLLALALAVGAHSAVFAVESHRRVIEHAQKWGSR